MSPDKFLDGNKSGRSRFIQSFNDQRFQIGGGFVDGFFHDRLRGSTGRTAGMTFNADPNANVATICSDETRLDSHLV